MMKKTQRRDAWNNIIKQKVSFLSIVVIAAMAVAAYLSMNFASRAIADNADRFLDEGNFRDAEVISTLLLSEDDLDALRATEGVADVEAMWQSSGTISSSGEKKDVAVRSLTERLNVPMLLSGRLPEAEDECVVDWETADALSLTIGDTVLIEGAQYLRTDSFTVCAIAKNSEHATNEMDTPGDRNLIVLPSAFDLEALDGCCMTALLRYADSSGINRFDKAYFSASAATTERIKALAGTQAEKRTEALHTAAGQQIAEGERELDDAKEQLTDARRQLDDGWTELADGETQADDAQRRLTDARAELTDAQRQLDDGERQLTEGKAQLDRVWETLRAAQDTLNAGQAELDDAQQQLDGSRTQLDEGWAAYHENEAKLADGRKQLDEGWAAYYENEAKLADAKRQLDEGEAQLIDAEAQLADAEAQLTEGRKELDEGWAEYYESEAQLAEAKQQLDEGEKQYEDAGKQLKEGEAALYGGASALSSGRAQLVTYAEQIENGKAAIRSTMKSTMDDFLVYTIGQDTSAFINWAQGDVINIDSAGATAMRFPITDEITIDLNQSLEGNIANVLSLLTETAITEADLQEAVEFVFNVIAPAMNDSIIGWAAQTIANEYAGIRSTYDSLADYARRWDAGHAEYIAGGEALAAGAGEYYAGLQQYKDARAELDAGWEQYEDGAAQLAEGLETLTQGEAEYESALASYEEGKEKLEKGRKELDENRAKYEEGVAQLAEGLATLNEGETEYADGLAQLTEGLATLQSGETDYASALAKFTAGRDELADGWAQYQDGLAQYNAAYDAYTAKYAEYNAALAQYQSGLTQYEEGTREYDDARRTLADGRSELDDGERRYAQSMADYLQGALQLAQARETLDGLGACSWVVLDVNGNASYQSLRGSIKNVSDLGMTFALIFIIVGALVIYATLGRIVEEQRRLVGATKALGLYKREIFIKYLVFGVGATLLGIIFGVALAYFLIQHIIMDGYGQFYNFDNSAGAFSPGLTLLVLVCGLILATAAVWIACSDLLRTTATGLMQEKAPSAKLKRSRWTDKLSLYARLILLNIQTDKKRVAVTIASVAGCCALLTAAFTMRQGILAATERQFDTVTRYDYAVTFSKDCDASAIPEARNALASAGAKTTVIRTETQIYSINGNLSGGTLFCGDLEEMQPFVSRVDSRSFAALPTQPDGVWISCKTAEVNSIGAGDEITLYDGSMNPHSASVAGVFNNYVRIDMVMDRESYATVFGAPPADNAILALLDGAEDAQIERILASAQGVARVETKVAMKALVRDLVSILDMIALLLVGIAAIMACFILLNLISMHINQKKRELTIMRVNGFTTREVIAYIARETVVTNLIGIVLGLGAGMLLGYRTVCLLEGSTAHFVHSVQPVALVLAVLITAGFSVILNVIALRKIKYLKLTDVA